MRISREHMLMDMARVVARRSTCARAQVGAIVALDSRPLVAGYNGTPARMPHCDHTCNCYPVVATVGDVMEWRETLHKTGCPAITACAEVVHAEANAIAFAAKHGVRLEGSSLYVTLAPCYNCACLVVNAGIVEVVYATPYRDDAGTTLLARAGISCRWVE